MDTGLPRELGAVVGDRYRIVRVLARGGTGVVYEAEHTWTGRRVAMKMLLPRIADGEEQMQRFRREARSAATLSHPNIVEVTDMGRDGPDGALFIVQALLAGEDLEQRLERVSTLDADELLDVLLPILDALRAAHEHGVLHRDIKPSNIFLVASGAAPGSRRGPPSSRAPRTPRSMRVRGTCSFVPKLIDFGASRPLTSGLEPIDLTRSGSIVGTPIYMSPEQIRADPLDARSDIWSIGVVMYRALTGRFPFDTSNVAVLFAEILTRRVSLITGDPRVPPHLAAIVHRALATDRDARYRSVAELIDALMMGPQAAPSPRTAERSEASEATPESDERTLVDSALRGRIQRSRRHHPPMPQAGELRESAEDGGIGGKHPRSLPDELTNVLAENERTQEPANRTLASRPDLAATRIVAEPTPTPHASRRPLIVATPARRAGRAPWRGRVRMGVSASRSAVEGDPLRDLERALGDRWSLRRFPSYSTLVDALCEDEIELAWLPPVAYLRARRLGPVHLLLSLDRGGQTSYGSAIVAAARAGIRSLGDIRGKRVAWVDVWSAAGYLMPRSMLRSAGLDPEQVFASQAFVGSHAAVLDAIEHGRADVGATYCAIDGQGSLVTAPWADRLGVSAVAVSGAIPGDAICAAGELSLRDAESMVEPLLALSSAPEGAALLRRTFGAERFAEGDPLHYQVLEGI